MTASNLPPIHLTRPSIRSTLDRRFWLLATLGTIASFVLLGLVSVIIANPVFTRTIPPDGAAIAVWIASAPLMGVLLATSLTSPSNYAIPTRASGPRHLDVRLTFMRQRPGRPAHIRVTDRPRNLTPAMPCHSGLTSPSISVGRLDHSADGLRAPAHQAPLSNRGSS
jgi:hypothetical protein